MNKAFIKTLDFLRENSSDARQVYHLHRELLEAANLLQALEQAKAVGYMQYSMKAYRHISEIPTEEKVTFSSFEMCVTKLSINDAIQVTRQCYEMRHRDYTEALQELMPFLELSKPDFGKGDSSGVE